MTTARAQTERAVAALIEQTTERVIQMLVAHVKTWPANERQRGWDAIASLRQQCEVDEKPGRKAPR